MIGRIRQATRDGLFLLLLLVSAAGSVFAQSPVFGSPLALPVQKSPLAIATGDFNGDGAQDLAVANSQAQTISVYFGNGTGAFTPAAGAITLPQGCDAAYLAAGVFTGAKSPDLLAVCALGPIVILPNAGSGNFGKPIVTTLPVGSWVGNLLFGYIHPAVADVNGDGHLDIAVPTFDTVNFGGGWSLLLGQGNGRFQQATALPFRGALATSIVAGDFNGDGKMDLVSAGYDDTGFYSLELCLGNGDGTFKFPLIYTLELTAGSTILAADVNGDGKLDLVIAGSSLYTDLTHGGLDQGDSAVTVMLGDGKGAFKESFNAQEPNYMSGVVLADVLGTGKLDLIESTIQANFTLSQLPQGAVQVRPGNGDGTFRTPIVLQVPSSTVATDLAAADFNGDGRPDIAFASIPTTAVKIDITLFSDFMSLLDAVLQQLPVGNAEVLLNLTAPITPTFTNTNAASFTTGALARGSIVTAFGTGMSTTTAIAGVTLPFLLGGDTITIKDAAGASTAAPLFFVSPAQINYAIPNTVANGQATITIQSGTKSFTATQQIVGTAPGLFVSSGMALGSAIKVVNGAQQISSLVENGAMVPIDVSGGQTFLVLYGTGIQNHAATVVANIGSAQANAAYAGPQGTYVGEDQINIQLPASLQGAGVVNVSLLVDGQSSNVAKIQIQ